MQTKEFLMDLANRYGLEKISELSSIPYESLRTMKKGKKTLGHSGIQRERSNILILKQDLATSQSKKDNFSVICCLCSERSSEKKFDRD